jgi:hypothetical protein
VARSSSTSLPRVGDDTDRAVRLLRLRGDEQLLEMLLPAHNRQESGRLRLRSREQLGVGDRVRIEVGLGALVDEIELVGRVVDVQGSGDDAAPMVVLALDASCEGQLAYLGGVLSGEQTARARAHRRIAVDVGVRWRYGELRQDTRARDVSRGGAFISSRLQPPIGTQVALEFDAIGTQGPLSLEAVVSWVQRRGTLCGFGVRFCVRSRDDAERIAQMIRTLGT